MADNYLEKHYAEYEARKAAWERARKLGKKKPRVTATAAPVKETQDKKSETSSLE